jgi:myo-inositol-1(or 4)-monophosphatase
VFNELKSIILQAGELLKEGFYAKKEVVFKGKKDLVTKYDIAIEEFLKKEFKKFNYTIIAEESVREEFNNSIIIDPIDGTTNFANKLPFCAISVAVYENKLPKYGFVYNPILNEFFSAKKGGGAFLNGKKIKVSSEDNFQKALIATGFPYSNSENQKDLEWVIRNLKNILPNCQDIRRFGSAAIDLCYTANGNFEGFYEINLNAWDVAAGMLILSEAGGKVTNEFGKSYDIFNDKTIVASNSLIHNKLLTLLN